MGERPEEAAEGPAARVDALRMLPQVHEHLLGDVLGGLPLEERPHRQPVDEACVAVVQVGEGRLVAAGQALDQYPLSPRDLMSFVHEASPLHIDPFEAGRRSGSHDRPLSVPTDTGERGGRAWRRIGPGDGAHLVMDIDIRDPSSCSTLSASTSPSPQPPATFYVSQPALSQRLLRLEDRLATPLFERRGRRLVANAAGRRMLNAAHVTLRELRAARLDLPALASASQCATNYQWMADVPHSLHQQHPGTELRVERLPDNDLVAGLLDDRLDVALVTKLDGDVNRVRLERLFDDELRVVVSSRHPLARRERVVAADFDDANLVLYDGYDQTRTPAVPLPIPPGARPARLTTVAIGTDMLIELVAMGEAVTVLPSWIVSPYVATHDVASVALGSPSATHVVLRHTSGTKRRRRRPHCCAPRPTRRQSPAGANEYSGVTGDGLCPADSGFERVVAAENDVDESFDLVVA